MNISLKYLIVHWTKHDKTRWQLRILFVCSSLCLGTVVTIIIWHLGMLCLTNQKIFVWRIKDLKRFCRQETVQHFA